MLCCELNLPGVFGWRIKGLGKCVELVQELKHIMHLPQSLEDTAEITVMSRSFYDSFSGKDCSDLKIFYSRKAVRLFHNTNSNTWLMVIPENILAERKTRTILMWLMLKPFYLHCFANGGLLVHAASACLNGKGIIISASGDTGKTTTVRRLPQPWQELGDDSALLLPVDSEFRLYPLPTWSEFIYGANSSASWDIQKETNIAGIFFLKQSEHDKGERLSSAVATMSLYQSSIAALGEHKKDVSKKLNTKIFETAGNITSKVPAFSLYASLNGKVWESIEKNLQIESEK